MTFTLTAHPQIKVRLAQSKDAERIAILCF